MALLCEWGSGLRTIFILPSASLLSLWDIFFFQHHKDYMLTLNHLCGLLDNIFMVLTWRHFRTKVLKRDVVSMPTALGSQSKYVMLLSKALCMLFSWHFVQGILPWVNYLHFVERVQIAVFLFLLKKYDITFKKYDNLNSPLEGILYMAEFGTHTIVTKNTIWNKLPVSLGIWGISDCLFSPMSADALAANVLLNFISINHSFIESPLVRLWTCIQRQ